MPMERLPLCNDVIEQLKILIIFNDYFNARHKFAYLVLKLSSRNYHPKINRNMNIVRVRTNNKLYRHPKLLLHSLHWLY